MKATADEQKIDTALFVKRMDNQVKEWDYPTLDSYIIDCVSGMTEEQIEHVAWFLSSRVEHRKREREMTMLQGDNQTDSAHGDPFDDPNYPPEK